MPLLAAQQTNIEEKKHPKQNAAHIHNFKYVHGHEEYGYSRGNGLEHIQEYFRKSIPSVRCVQTERSERHVPDDDDHEEHNIVIGLDCETAKGRREGKSLDEVCRNKSHCREAYIKGFMCVCYEFLLLS